MSGDGFSEGFGAFLHAALTHPEAGPRDVGDGMAVLLPETITETFYTLDYNLGDERQLQRLADALQLDTASLAAVIMGEKPVTADMARRLENVTHVSAEVWTELPATRSPTP